MKVLPHFSYLSKAIDYCVHYSAYAERQREVLIYEAARQPALYKDLWCFAKYLEEQENEDEQTP